MQSWQLQTAKARLSDVVKGARQHGPQDITVHGKSVAVLVSRELFDRLSGNSLSLAEFMQRSPLAGLDALVLERDKSPVRDVAL